MFLYGTRDLQELMNFYVKNFLAYAFSFTFSAGGMALSTLVTATVNSISMLARSSITSLQTWSLHGLLLTIEAAGLSYVSQVQVSELWLIIFKIWNLHSWTWSRLHFICALPFSLVIGVRIIFVFLLDSIFYFFVSFVEGSNSLFVSVHCLFALFMKV